jgi:hypothetical protein
LEIKVKEMEEEVQKAREREGGAREGGKAAVRMQQLLQGQLQSLIEELSVRVSPFEEVEEDKKKNQQQQQQQGREGEEDSAYSPEASAPKPSQQQQQQKKSTAKSKGPEEKEEEPEEEEQQQEQQQLHHHHSHEESVLQTSYNATRLELTLARSLTQQLHSSCSSLHQTNQHLSTRLAALEKEHLTLQETAREMHASLQQAESDFIRQAQQKEGLEKLLSEKEEESRKWECLAWEAEERVEEGREARRELEGFAQQFRRDVERAAEERVGQALSQASERVEELIKKNAIVREVAEEGWREERREGEEQVGRLTRALVESRAETTRREREVGRLREELEKAAREIARWRTWGEGGREGGRDVGT